MRSNLVFTNVPESAIEGQVKTEEKIRTHLVDKMKITKEQVDKISFERVHRMGVKQIGCCKVHAVQRERICSKTMKKGPTIMCMNSFTTMRSLKRGVGYK